MNNTKICGTENTCFPMGIYFYMANTLKENRTKEESISIADKGGDKKMKTKTKQRTVIIALLLLCTAILSCMGGCTKNDNRFDTDLFRCMYNEDKTGVIILELTEKGQEQEILVIPEEINGLPVVQLGGETRGYPYNIPHSLKSETLKKLYVCSTDYITAKEYFPNLSEVFIVNENAFASLALRPGDTTLNNYTGEIDVFTTEEVLIKYRNEIETANSSRKYKRANIVYYRQNYVLFYII